MWRLLATQLLTLLTLAGPLLCCCQVSRGLAQLGALFTGSAPAPVSCQCGGPHAPADHQPDDPAHDSCPSHSHTPVGAPSPDGGHRVEPLDRDDGPPAPAERPARFADLATLEARRTGPRCGPTDRTAFTKLSLCHVLRC
jgi:hypothetical protein